MTKNKIFQKMGTLIKGANQPLTIEHKVINTLYHQDGTSASISSFRLWQAALLTLIQHIINRSEDSKVMIRTQLLQVSLILLVKIANCSIIIIMKKTNFWILKFHSYNRLLINKIWEAKQAIIKFKIWNKKFNISKIEMTN